MPFRWPLVRRSTLEQSEATSAWLIAEKNCQIASLKANLAAYEEQVIDQAGEIRDCHEALARPAATACPVVGVESAMSAPPGATIVIVPTPDGVSATAR